MHAVAGIGNPKRFFDLLRAAGIQVIEHSFPDHTLIRKEQMEFGDDFNVFMTEKDAVKCRSFAQPNFWYLSVNTKLPDEFLQGLLNEIKQLCTERKN